MTGWVCQWKPFWIPVDDTFKKAYVEDWVFQIPDTYDFSLPGGQEDIIPETPGVTLPVPSSQREAPKPRFLLVLRNTLRHHCLRCSHDPHVNVWSCISPVIPYCQATRIFTCLVQISLPCGVR